MTINVHDVALGLESVCKKALKLETLETYNGIVTAGNIEGVGKAYHVITVALAPYFKKSESAATRKKIEDFLGSCEILSYDVSDEVYKRELEKATNGLELLLEEIE